MTAPGWLIAAASVWGLFWLIEGAADAGLFHRAAGYARRAGPPLHRTATRAHLWAAYLCTTATDHVRHVKRKATR